MDALWFFSTGYLSYRLLLHAAILRQISRQLSNRSGALGTGWPHPWADRILFFVVRSPSSHIRARPPPSSYSGLAHPPSSYSGLAHRCLAQTPLTPADPLLDTCRPAPRRWARA